VNAILGSYPFTVTDTDSSQFPLPAHSNKSSRQIHASWRRLNCRAAFLAEPQMPIR